MQAQLSSHTIRNNNSYYTCCWAFTLTLVMLIHRRRKEEYLVGNVVTHQFHTCQVPSLVSSLPWTIEESPSGQRSTFLSSSFEKLYSVNLCPPRANCDPGWIRGILLKWQCELLFPSSPECRLWKSLPNSSLALRKYQWWDAINYAAGMAKDCQF